MAPKVPDSQAKAVPFSFRELPRWLSTVVLTLFVLQALAVPGDGHWDRQFGLPGTASRNYALRFNGNSLYTAGYSITGGFIATNTVVNIFDGTNWSTIGDLTGGTDLIEDFAFLGTDVYVGGIFTRAGGVPVIRLPKWDGQNWSGVGGFAGVVFGMTTDRTNLYVGGGFTNAGGVLITNLARWDGTNWSAIGGGIGYYEVLSSAVHDLAWHNGQLYIAGSFTNAGTTAATNLARWDGDTWSQIGGGVGGPNDTVSSFQFLADDLYVAGRFTIAGGVPALNIARWDGNAWSPLGTGLKAPPNNTPVNALAFLGSDLYATGGFTNAGGIATSRVAKWDGFAWNSLGGINGTGIRAISNSGSIYICGDFNAASTVLGNHIIRFDGLNWYGVTGKPAQGTHIFVNTLALGNDSLYMGGFFTTVGTTVASRIARWDRTNWYALGEGVSGSYNGNSIAVRAIKARNNEIYVGGDFANASGVTVNNVALWNGDTWSPLGFGVDAGVFAIDTSDTKVYVGGGFTNAYDFPGLGAIVNRIATWDPVNGWFPLGDGVGGTVNAIAVQGNLVYVGGSFTTAGGIPANRIAMWTGGNWSPLGTGSANGVGGTVNAILADGADIYVGGSFTTAGGSTARGAAKWNGSSWSPLGQGVFASGTASVRALAKIGNYLYAAGTFTNAGGSVIARSIARWDGSQWDALGSGIGNDLPTPRGTTLAAWGNDLFVGGIFETAGVGDAGYIARWNDQIDFTPPSVMRLSNPGMFPGNTFTSRATATEGAAYVIEYSADLLNWASLTTNSLPSLDVTDSAPGVNVRAYRMKQIP